MHSAPSVSFPVGRNRVEAVVLALFWGVGVLTAGLWMQAVEPAKFYWLAMFACLALSGLLAVRAHLASHVGELRWDGLDGAWSLSGAEVLGRPVVCLDFHSCMVVRLRCRPAGNHWLWLSRRDRVLWGDLRRALYARVRNKADQSAGAMRGMREPER